jgi:hypothetical protein
MHVQSVQQSRQEFFDWNHEKTMNDVAAVIRICHPFFRDRSMGRFLSNKGLVTVVVVVVTIFVYTAHTRSCSCICCISVVTESSGMQSCSPSHMLNVELNQCGREERVMTRTILGSIKSPIYNASIFFNSSRSSPLLLPVNASDLNWVDPFEFFWDW